jgi:magnesium chelatase family protein
MLVCAMNPCACGYLGDGSHRCACTPERVRQYRGRLSGPLLDRIDVHVVLPPVEVGALQQAKPGESSADVRTRVARARDAQTKRAAARELAGRCNAALTARDVERAVTLCNEGTRLLGAAMTRLSLSARAYGKVLRVARTIADLEGARDVAPAHVAEAIGLRVLDRGAALAAA